MLVTCVAGENRGGWVSFFVSVTWLAVAFLAAPKGGKPHWDLGVLGIHLILSCGCALWYTWLFGGARGLCTGCLGVACPGHLVEKTQAAAVAAQALFLTCV